MSKQFAPALLLLLAMLAGCGEQVPVGSAMPDIVKATAYPIAPRAEQVLLTVGGHPQWRATASQRFLDAELNRTCLDLSATDDRAAQVAIVERDLPDIQPTADEAGRVLDRLQGGLCASPPSTEYTAPPAPAHRPAVGPGADP